MKVKGHPDLERKRGGAIVNTNTQKLQAAKRKIKNERQQEEQISRLTSEVEELKSMVKDLLDGR